MLASIVQADPIYVNFNISEQDVLVIRAEIARRGLTAQDLNKVPVEVGLQTETGYPHRGTLDYRAPTVNQSTGTLAARAILQNPGRVLLPGYFVRVRIPLDAPQDALLVPDVALGSDQGGRYVLVVNKDNVVEQRKVEIGQLVDDHAGDREGAWPGRSRSGQRDVARPAGPEGRSADANGRQCADVGAHVGAGGGTGARRRALTSRP